MAKRARNAFAVCRAIAKKKGWGQKKFKRCAEKVKRSMRMGKK